VRALLRPLFARSAWSQPATMVAGTTGEGADLASVPSVGVGSTSICGGGKTDEALLGPLFSLSAWVQQPPCWLARQVRELLWPLVA
jgi:hypothetical protein